MSAREVYYRQQHEQRERLFRGTRLYDKIRPLFDLPNTSPLPITYYERDANLRPHLRDRVMKGEFTVADEDRITAMGYGTGVPVRDVTQSPRAYIEITLFPEDQTGNAGSINIRLLGSLEDTHIVLGSIRPSGETKGMWHEDAEVEQCLSLFELTGKLLDSHRLRPVVSDDAPQSGEVVVGATYEHMGNPTHTYTVVEIFPNATGYEETGKIAGELVKYRQNYDGEKAKTGDSWGRVSSDFTSETEVGGKRVKKFTRTE